MITVKEFERALEKEDSSVVLEAASMVRAVEGEAPVRVLMYCEDFGIQRSVLSHLRRLCYRNQAQVEHILHKHSQTDRVEEKLHLHGQLRWGK